jgi:hypothetical protein
MTALTTGGPKTIDLEGVPHVVFAWPRTKFIDGVGEPPVAF